MVLVRKRCVEPENLQRFARYFLVVVSDQWQNGKAAPGGEFP